MEKLENPGKDAEMDTAALKKGRHRSRHKFNSIRTQMEFYFSDANLTKSRYMAQLLQNGPFIPLEEFLKFNKIKALTSSVEEIGNALTNSTLLELSEDNTKVRRMTELVVKENCDECTIYVERLPPKANHEWVKNVFSSYGKVSYVSLPTFKHSGKIKEFGFVEFDEEASVQKVLKAFQTFGGVLAFETTDPAKMASIKTYEQGKLEMPHEDGSEVKESGKNNSPEEDSSTLLGGALQSSTVPGVVTDKKEDEDCDEPPAKRHRIEPTSDDEDDDTQDEQQSAREANGKKLDRTSDDEFHTDHDDRAGEEDNKDGTEAAKDIEHGNGQDMQLEAGGKKKCRQRKGCSIIKKELQLDDKVYELKIMTKKEWRRLRNKYLNLQKQEAKNLKRLFQQTNKHHKRGHPKATTSNPGSGIAIKSIKSSPRVNFYGAMPVDEEQGEMDGTNALQPEVPEESVAIAKRPLFSFEPGLIVSIKFREPCVDVKDFRTELRQHPYVKYIDLKEGSFEAFVRVDKPASANALVREYNSAEYGAHILSGEQEQQYWDKMMRDREDKLNMRVKKERIRGRTKLIRKINNHVKFDDDDD
ncbi:la-related protein 7 [Anopheles funestus]|uniref:la-related protein 7 n=1 Tax=Anopheles funestus TaxID=62324 RepID=UPI0020C7449D|nr:la-related protein 7 [Anopheles funestus]